MKKELRVRLLLVAAPGITALVLAECAGPILVSTSGTSTAGVGQGIKIVTHRPTVHIPEKARVSTRIMLSKNTGAQ